MRQLQILNPPGKAGLKEMLISDELELEVSMLDLVKFFSLFDKQLVRPGFFVCIQNPFHSLCSVEETVKPGVGKTIRIEGSRECAYSIFCLPGWMY